MQTLKWLRAGLASLALCACALATGRTPALVQVESDGVRVTGTRFLDAGISHDTWMNFVKSGDEPFDERNSTFWIRIEDRSARKSVKRPMVPISNLFLLDHGRIVVALSTAYPTSGIVVLDRNGRILGRRVRPCFGGNCTVISDGIDPWYDSRVAIIEGDSDPEGRVCEVRVRETSDPNAETISVPICAGSKAASHVD